MTEAFVIVIDPGATSGLSAWAHGRPVLARSVEVPGRLPRTVMVAELRAALDVLGNPDPGATRVVIEGWLNPRGLPTVKALHRNKEAWLDAAAEFGIDNTSEIDSNDWQRGMGCTGERAERKRMSRILAADVLRRAGLPCPADCDDLDENVADSVTLGEWWHEEVRTLGMPRALATDGRREKREKGRGTSRWSPEDAAAHLARTGGTP